MSMNYDGDKPITEQDGVMFAATPAWERGRKRRGLGPKKAPRTAAATPAVAPEPRTFAAEREDPMARNAPLRRPVDRVDQTTAYAMGPAAATPTIGETLEAEDAGLAAPIHRPSAHRNSAKTGVKTGGVSPAAITAGAVAVIVAGGIGMFAMRGGDGGVPELTPGATTTREIAAAPVEAPPAAPTLGQRAENILPERAARRRPRPRVRPAARRAPGPPGAATRETSGTNASAAIPAGPQPYSTLSPGAAPSSVNPAAPPLITLPPAQAAPAPEPIPSPPPVTSTEPATTSPTAPETTTPPQ
ncbi:hypothetical protein [Phenylobacterium sp.]|uniref:hypothetical protein n=1 Tax=Phenylobacterium sp. TaxID=1871053 RepID=UPI0025F44940|nr:hypothetical protein [Phenylobacterium sp.]MBX3484203.1 hypothetical protein [Phenylobacterium sp.]